MGDVPKLAPVPRRIALLAFPGCQSLDIAGPLEVFHGASERRGGHERGYEPLVVGFDAGPVRSESGLRLSPDLTLEELLQAGTPPIDTLIVAGGPGVRTVAQDPAQCARVRQVAAHAARVASVCTGSFVLAACGLLDGRRATTHWAYCDELASFFPNVRVEREPIYVRDGHVWSSAGVTAGIDLALALVEQDLGAELAIEVARQLVVFVRRSGAQPQLSAQLSAQAAERRALQELTGWMVEHPGADLSIPRLAKRCGMSARHFARLFRQQLGITPARYVERVRAEHARRLLESSEQSIEQVAERAGFASAEALRRVLRRTLGISPGAYRKRARATAMS